MYARQVLLNQGLYQLSKTKEGTFKCRFCEQKEYIHYQSLTKHKKSCEMNPDKKRKTGDDDEDMEQKLFQASADTNYNKIMATDCNDRKKIQRVFDMMEPFAAGLLHQRFVNMDLQFNRDKEEFEKKQKENEKVLRVLESFGDSPTPAATASSSSISGGMLGSITGMLGGGAQKKA